MRQLATQMQSNPPLFRGSLGVGPFGYAAVTPISTFTASHHEQHPTDLAMLQGVRCAIAQETEEGRSWATAKLKMMTGATPSAHDLCGKTSSPTRRSSKSSSSATTSR